MKVTFVCGGAERLGPQYLSAALKQAGHRTQLAFDPMLFNDRIYLQHRMLAKFLSYHDQLIRDICKTKPDMVCISAETDTYSWACSIAKAVKGSIDVPVLMGGMHPTFVPETVIQNSYVDAICLGEGEDAIVEFANSVEQGKNNHTVKNLWFKNNGKVTRNEIRPLVENLDLLPYPDRSIFKGHINTKDSYLAMSGRGCLFGCSYCFNNALRKVYKGKGRYLRRMSPERFVEMLLTMKQRYRYKFLKIYDDIFTHDIKWLKRFARLYKNDIGLPYFCLGHPLYINEEVVKLLKSTGCEWVQLGVESFSKKTRDCINRREPTSNIIKTIRLMDRYRLKYELDHIFGLPEDDEESYILAANIYKNCKSLQKVNTNIISYIPKTDIIETSRKHNLVVESDIASIALGREDCRVNTGSVKDKKMLRLYKNYMMLYKMMSIVPPFLIDIILKLKLQHLLGIFEPMLGHAVRLFCMDTVDRLYLKSNAWMIRKVAIARIRRWVNVI